MPSWHDPPAVSIRPDSPIDLSQILLSEDPAFIDGTALPKDETVNAHDDDIDVVWEPIPNSSQFFAINTRAQHTLYHGARGPGKTITQLMRYRSRVGIGYGSYWKGIIFDREFKHLSDLVTQSKRFFPQFEDGCQFLSSPSEYKWKWPSGEELLFRHVKELKDYDAFHGHEYPFIGWNELTKHPTLEVYDKFMSVNRSSFNPEKHTPRIKVNGRIEYQTHNGKPLPPIPLEVFSTTNPNGPGHNAVKRRFIDVAENGRIVRRTISYFDTVKAEEINVERTQVAIFGSFHENPYIDPIYKAGLIEACEHDPHLHAAWVKGDWSVNSGGAIDDLWKEDIHVVPRFKVPSDWYVDRSFDWGSTHPFACVWWAESNGEEVKFENGETWCPQAGSLIGVYDYYGTKDIGSNRGLKMSAKDIAIGIKEREEIMKNAKWVSGEIWAGPADNQIRNVTESDVDTIEFKMEQEGITWTKSDKSPGSRIIGLQLMRERLQAAVTGEGPAIYFMKGCSSCIEILPALPRDEKKPDDVDTDAEDHIWDAVRYRVLRASNKWARSVNVDWSR